MNRTTLRKNHKWVGLAFAFFMLMFCMSGVVLNHRSEVAHLSVGRQWLPGGYRFKSWNGGLLRGSIGEKADGDSVSRVFVFGNSGIWLTDTDASSFKDCNSGLPDGADYRNIKGMCYTPDGQLWALAQFGLYRKVSTRDEWVETKLPAPQGERWTDIAVKQDTLAVMSRSHLYVATAPYTHFEKREICAPQGYDGKVSLFKTIWNLHSGEMLGTAGKLFMDGVAVVLMVICITGVAFWLLPIYMKKTKSTSKRCRNLLKGNLNWHDKLGRYTFGILIFVSLTGWCLRPPVLIALVKGRVPAIPYTAMDDTNPWRDRPQVLKTDNSRGDWLLSTTEGLYTLPSLTGTPVKMEQAERMYHRLLYRRNGEGGIGTSLREICRVVMLNGLPKGTHRGGI